MKFYIYTLGCKVNSYESRIMTEDLINAGYVEEKDNNIPADIYIINTCSVTNTADSKSLKLIRQAIKKNKDAIIVVCGCLAQVKPETVNIEGVDIVIGNKNKSKVSEYINEYVKNKNKKTDIYDISNVEFETMQLNNFDKTRAFIKIQDGCNNFCAYCIIPYTRGSVRSKPREDILNEIDHLTLNGHKEIVLTGIHTGNYGSEFDNYDFADLLNEIVKIKKLSRIRISSIEITELNDRVLEKINKIRKIRPDISITTDVIVGFPNETDKNFNETIETIKKVDFSKLHVFPYSKREGTKAATMEGQIKEEVKKQRVMELLKLSKELENKYMNKFIGKTLTFIPEVYKDGYLIGHTGNYLLIKLKGWEELLHKEVSVKLMENQYPYIISSAI